MNGSDKCEQLASSEPSKQQLCAGNNQNAGWLMYPEKKVGVLFPKICYLPAGSRPCVSSRRQRQRAKARTRQTIVSLFGGSTKEATESQLVIHCSYINTQLFWGDGHKVVVAVGFFSVAESEVTFAVICSTAESDLTFQSDVDASVD